MKYFEIILKLAFLIFGIYVYKTYSGVVDVSVYALMAVSTALGITLLFNKKQSYGYELSAQEVVMRRIEGGALLAFVIVFLFFIIKGNL